MSIFSPKKEQNITIIRRKSKKILMSVGGFLGKFYFLCYLKFYQKPNSQPKNNLFSRKRFAKKNHDSWMKHVLTCFITLWNFYLQGCYFFATIHRQN